jgi:MtrB/PioB family decaheme-associated outer membrane protein
MNAPSAGRPALAGVAGLCLTAIAAALAAAGAAWADERDDEIAKLAKPSSEVSIGAGSVSDDNTRFGQYNGLTKDRLYLLFDLNYRSRDDATGSWLNITGRNLGFDNRELRLEQSQQGNWGYYVDFSETPRYSPYTALTRLVGYDSSTQTVNGAPTPVPVELKTERKTLNAGLNKYLASRWDVRLDTRYEEKTGRRLYGRTGSDFLVDPIDYRTQLYEATVGYTGERLQMTGGYFGSNFVNNKPRLDVVGGTGTGFSPLALPPGNESHQFNIGGGYSLSPTTRATFKYAYTHQTQNETFIDTSTTGRTTLGGLVDTTFGQIGLTMKPMKDFSLLADLKHENRDDKTPVVDYFNITTTTTATGVNEPRTIHSTLGKLEGTYQLAAATRVTAGLDYDQRRRNTSDVHVVSYRETTQETTWRVELRRAMSETLNGSIGYFHSRRGGSEWQTTMRSDGTLGSNLLQPIYLADRNRDKIRLTSGWTPTEKLDLQARVEASKDEYGGRTLGTQDGSAQLYSLDASYQLTDNWQFTTWLSRDDTRANLLNCSNAGSSNTGNLSACPATAADPIWSAHLRNVGNALGIGIKGKPHGQVELAADFQLSNDRAEFRNGPTTTGVQPVPDVKYNRSVTRLSAKYAMEKNAGVRLQYIHDRFSTNDYMWDNTWTYSDGTRIMANPQQTVNFLGASYYYNF